MIFFKFKRIAIFFLVLILILVAIFFLIAEKNKLVIINGKFFVAETATSPEKQEKGLSGRRKICAHCAMLFEFKKSDNYVFWTKNMRFDLDILWIEKNKIKHIEKNISHNFKGVLDPETKADKVLEINAGLTDKYGIKIGDRIKIWGNLE
jgi:hypothetical protein